MKKQLVGILVVGGDRKGAKSGSGGIARKALSPRLSPVFCSWGAG
jgi:hypothetical protein